MADVKNPPGVGIGGNEFNPQTKTFPGVPYEAADFNRCPGEESSFSSMCPTSDCLIHNYKNETEVI